MSRHTRETADSLFEGSVSCLCWAHNEELAIAQFVYRMNDLLKCSVREFEIIISDDCSTDRTRDIVKSIQKQIPEVRLIENKEKNFGETICAAVAAARKDYVFWQTADWSYDIHQLRVFLELLKKYDVVAGVRPRYVRAADLRHPRLIRFLKLFSIPHLTKRSDTLGKAIISVVNYILIRALFQVPISDFQNVVFYPRKLLQSFRPESRSSFLNPEYLLKAYWRGAKIAEVPIPFLPREIGESKGTRIGNLSKSIFQVFQFWVRWILWNRKTYQNKGSVKRLDLSEWDLGKWGE